MTPTTSTADTIDDSDRPERELRDLLLRQELDDVRADYEDARERERRHWTVAVFGASPSVVIVALGLLASGSWPLLVAFSVVVTLVEGWRASHAGREAYELSLELDRLRMAVGPASDPAGEDAGEGEVRP